MALTSATCQGYSCCSAACPPTILPLAAPPFFPHWHWLGGGAVVVVSGPVVVVVPGPTVTGVVAGVVVVGAGVVVVGAGVAVVAPPGFNRITKD